MSNHPFAGLRPSVLAIAVSALLAAGAMPPSTAHAQDAPRQERRTYAIEAGTLEEVLTRFTAAAGIALSFDPALVDGLRSAGLSGSHSNEEGLRRVLQGSGLEVVARGKGGYALRKVLSVGPAAGREATLAPVTVVARSDGLDGVTEGTGAYIPAGPVAAASPLALPIRETPQSVSVMTSQRMEDQQLTTIRQTLEQTPGITLVSSGTERFQATSRGYQITNYQLDGVNSHSDYGGAAGPASQSLADMAMFDRVELVRGAAGLATGAGDPSGAVNMVRKKPTRNLQIAVDGSAGSWDSQRGVLDVSGPLNASGTLRGRLIGVAQGGDGFTDHYNQDKHLVYGVVEADLGDATRLAVGVDRQSTTSRGSSTYVGFPLWFSDGGQADLPVSISLASRDNRFETTSTTAFASLAHPLPAGWTLKVSGTHGESSQKERSVYLDANGRFADRQTGDGLILDAAGRTYDTRFATLDVNLGGSLDWLGRKHEVVVGLAHEDYKKIADGFYDTSGLDGQPANLYTWDRSGAAVFDLKAIDWDAYRKQTSAYAMGRFELSEGLKLVTGTRVINYEDRLHTANIYGYLYEPSSSEKGVFTPYGGLLYDIGQAHTAYVSYSTIYQPQYARDSRGELIAPREGTNVEVGLKSSWLNDRLGTAVAAYRIRQNNLTETDPAYVLVPGTTAEYASRVIPGAKTEGVDLEATGALSPQWNISASYTYSRTVDGTGKAVRTTFPRHLAKLWTTYRMPGPWRGLTVGAGVNWQSKIHSTIYSWTLDRDLYWEQKSYALLNLMARYDFSDNTSVTLNVNNVLDKKYVAAANDWWYSGNYGAPRSVAVHLRHRF